MSRKTTWRRTCPDALVLRIRQAAEARLYILRNLGPTGYLLKEHESDAQFKVYLGDPHTCSCALYLKEHELCLHILWILTKKFRVPEDNPAVFQLGLVEREIDEIIHFRANANKKVVTKIVKDNGQKTLEQKKIDEDDVCPICQDDLFKTKEILTFCKYGCGNSVHVKCMKVWAEHQYKSTAEGTIKCPLCRSEFGTLQSIIQEYHRAKARQKRSQENLVHTGTQCRNCRIEPIKGKCYKCMTCAYFYLCHACFQTGVHSEHDFEFRLRILQRWRPAIRILTDNHSSPLNALGSRLHSNSEVRHDFSNIEMIGSAFTNSPPSAPSAKLKSIRGNLSKQSSVRHSSQPDLTNLNFQIHGRTFIASEDDRAVDSDPGFCTLPPIAPKTSAPNRAPRGRLFRTTSISSRQESNPLFVGSESPQASQKRTPTKARISARPTPISSAPRRSPLASFNVSDFVSVLPVESATK